MRWDELVQPVPDFADKLHPVAIVSGENFEARIVTTLLGIPHELHVRRANVLGCLDKMNELTASCLAGRILDKIWPRLLLAEVMELEIVKGDLVVHKWSVAIEERQHIVAILYPGLVQSQSQELALLEVPFSDPAQQGFSVPL